MSWTRRSAAIVAVLLLAGIATLTAGAAEDGFITPVKRYAKGVPGGGWNTKALLSVGDKVPETGNPGFQYQMIGIPDGLGAYTPDRRHDGHDNRVVKVFMNHELTQPTLTGPRVGRPQQRGAFVSEYLLAEDGSVLFGKRAFDTVYEENTLVGPAAQVGNTTPGFSRFCSSSLELPEQAGFDRPIFITGRKVEAPRRSTVAAVRRSPSSTARRTRCRG